MIRKLALFVVVTALIVSACGRQVTPDRAGTNASGLDSGFMQIKFRVQAPFDYNNYRYVIAFNTTGNGTSPYSNGANTNYLNYSFEFIVAGSGGVVPYPALYEFYNENQNGGPTQVQPVSIPYAQGIQVLFQPNSNGLGTEFTIIFQRSLLYGIPLTPSPAPTSAPTANPSDTPSPTPSPTPVGNNPLAVPTSATQNVWYFNFFTAQVNGSGQLIPLDALGQNGVNDTSFSMPLDTQATFDQPYYVPAGSPAGPTASSSLAGADIANAP